MKYRLANGAADYTLCKELIAAEQVDIVDLDFPTVMAIDDDEEVVGVMGTVPHEEMVLAGPLVLRHDKRRPFTAIKMLQLYEITMRGLGMKSVIFSTETDSFVDSAVRRYFPDIAPYAYKDGNRFYVWPLHKQAQE